jgi:hypothetical protein
MHIKPFPSLLRTLLLLPPKADTLATNVIKTSDSIWKKPGAPEGTSLTRGRCYDFFLIFAEKFSEKIGVFVSKQSQILKKVDHNISF